MREAAGSISKRASPYLPVACFGFGKASFQSTPFGSICLLFLVESRKKLKQTPPEARGEVLFQLWLPAFPALPLKLV
jgi:hypothetical protein